MKTKGAGPARTVPAPADRLIAALEGLEAAHALGDVKDKPYEQRKQEVLEQIGLARVHARLAPGERVLARHHYQLAHFPFTGVALRDVAQEGVSYYATESRLFRWSFADRPGRRWSALGTGDSLEWRDYTQLGLVARRREYRWGEAGVALAMIVVALLLLPHLAFSGPILVFVGAAGLAHALLVPTPYWLVAAADEASAWRVYAARQASARALIETVQAGRERGCAPGHVCFRPAHDEL
ncbi:MAG: hypothetical protein ACYC4L_11265 [Chloroflexota bacterium]